MIIELPHTKLEVMPKVEIPGRHFLASPVLITRPPREKFAIQTYAADQAGLGLIIEIGCVVTYVGMHCMNPVIHS